jgi:hypothetical protein
VADYFLVLDGPTFEEQIRPALGLAWKMRSFEPCQPLCVALEPAARTYVERYHTGAAEPLLCRVASGLPFDRTYWRTLAGEVLLFAAVEIPEFQTCPATLCRLLAPGQDPDASLPRPQQAPILQAHQGSRDLTFGTAVYRPEYAGYNNAADVARLTDFLDSVRPELWTLADLPGLEDIAEEDLADELAFAVEWFPALRDLYRRAKEQGHVLVVESIY